jgi:hypothetical protein
MKRSQAIITHQKKEISMSLAAHLATLEEKHYRLEAIIEDEVSRPMPDFTVIQTLKKQKLLIKEELARLQEYGHQQRGSSAS